MACAASGVTSAVLFNVYNGILLNKGQEYVVPFRTAGQPTGALPRTARIAAKNRPSDRSSERRSVLRAVDAYRAGDFVFITLAPLPNQSPLFYHEVKSEVLM